MTIILKHEEIGKHSQRITKTKPFIDRYKNGVEKEGIWEGINFPPDKDYWKKFQKNNPTIALNVLYAKKEKNISSLCFKT